jgi:hypothetical protein
VLARSLEELHFNDEGFLVLQADNVKDFFVFCIGSKNTAAKSVLKAAKSQ